MHGGAAQRCKHFYSLVSPALGHMKRSTVLGGHLLASRMTFTRYRAGTPLEEWYRRLSSLRSLVERPESARRQVALQTNQLLGRGHGRMLLQSCGTNRTALCFSLCPARRGVRQGLCEVRGITLPGV